MYTETASRRIGLYEMVPGVIVGFVCVFVFNRFGAAPTAGMRSDFDAVK